MHGREAEFNFKSRLARARFTLGPAVVSALGGRIVLVSGSFIFYNTNVLNQYQPDAAWVQRSTAYEQHYDRSRCSPVPGFT